MRRVKNIVIENGEIDFLIVAVFFMLSLTSPLNAFKPSEPQLAGFLASLATIAGTLTATVAFVCTLLYQTMTTRMRMLIKAYGETLSRSWTIIISISILVSCSAVLLTAFTHNTYWSSKIAITLLLLIALQGIRATWWLRALFKIANAEATQPERATLAKDPKLQTLQYQN